MANADTGYVRVAEFTKDSATKLKQAIDGLTKTGATRFIIDVRSTARGDLDDGIAAARLFVKTGTLTVRLTRGDMREPISSGAGDGAVAAPLALLVDQGTAGPAECLPQRSQRTIAPISLAFTHWDAPRASA